MKHIVLERNVEYALLENLIYAIIFLTALLVGTTFFSEGKIAIVLGFLSGVLLLICSVAILIKKGLVWKHKLFRGYFLFGQLIYKKEIENPASDTFTLMVKNYRQKFIRPRREQDWSYSVMSFELFYFDHDGAIQNPIIKCLKIENCEKAKNFLVEHSSLKFKSLY